MRITEQQKIHIRNAVMETVGEKFGENIQIRLFGSRTDNHAKGGDIDILVTLGEAIEDPAVTIARIAAKAMMKMQGQKIDVLIDAPNLDELPIHLIARENGILI